MLEELYTDTFADYQADSQSVVEFVGDSMQASPELAAYMVVANAMMNLDGFVMRE